MEARKPIMMMMVAFPNSWIIRMSLVLSPFLLIAYATFLLTLPSDFVPPSIMVPCSFHKCLHKVQTGYKPKAVLQDTNLTNGPKQGALKTHEMPSFLYDMERGMMIGTVNMDREDLIEWSTVFGETISISFEKASRNLEWKYLFPEWIDEEEENDISSCPKIPMPDFNNYGYIDMVVVKIPCKHPEEGWQRDVFQLRLHLVVAVMVVKRGRTRAKVVVESKCRPMMEFFRCDDLVKREGNWWYYEPDINWLEQKVSLPFGTCELALPLWEEGVKQTKREAYATVLHSSESFVCGAITLAQSLLKTGTKRHLILLIDTSISLPKRNVLEAAGWSIRIVERIGNPRSANNTYNKYNYTKLRLWQLTNYHKIIFIDSDIIVLRNLDHLFAFPQLSAVGNSKIKFNSGIMVIEPSKCTFMHFMQRTKEVMSYNGGDQGFLNEMFVYWHRLPRRVNFLKYLWANTTEETNEMNALIAADPPKLYAIHYLGRKPWSCYRRDYDCNWELDSPYDYRMYANDVAHQRWWKVYDAMDESLKTQCE